jgi:hypothetical protein
VRVAAVVALAFLGCAGCDQVWGLDRGDTISRYAFRKAITITPNRAFDLLDVPISVVLAADADLVANARSDGQDLVFAAPDGTVLGHEIVAYDPMTGALEAWVRVPSLPGADVTQVFLYYGGPMLPSAIGNTWPPSCAAVWHMSESSTLEHDSTSNAHDASGSVAPARMVGIVGSARDLAVSTPLSAPATGLDFGTGSFGFSLWVRVHATLGPSDSPFYKGGSSQINAGYSVLLGNAGWGANVSDGAGTSRDIELTAAPITDEWVQLGMVVDQVAKTARTFVNGAEITSADLGPSFGSTSNSARRLELGGMMYPYQGGIDELRVYAAAPREGWFAIEYENLTDRARFLQVGDQEVR